MMRRFKKKQPVRTVRPKFFLIDPSIRKSGVPTPLTFSMGDCFFFGKMIVISIRICQELII